MHRSAHGVVESLHRLDLLRDRTNALARGVERHVRRAKGVPTLCRFPPLLWAANAATDPGFDTERTWITTHGAQVVAQTRQLARHPFVGLPKRYPPLAISRRPLQHCLNATTEPDRDGPLDRRRINASVLNAVE